MQYLQEILVDAPPQESTKLLGNLPAELLGHLATLLNTGSFLAILSTSRSHRACLMQPFIKDTVARKERWYWPGTGPASQHERTWWSVQLTKLEEDHPGACGPGFDWRYLKRCYRCPSMMNRKRIWGCVEQIEVAIKENLS